MKEYIWRVLSKKKEDGLSYYQIFTVADGVRDLVREETYPEDARDAAMHEHFCTGLPVVIDEVKLNDRCQLIRRTDYNEFTHDT